MIQNLISFFFFLLNDSSKYLIYPKVSHQWHFWYLGPGDSLFGGCPVHCRMFSNISDHYQILVALHQLWQPKMPLDVAQGPLGNRSTPNWQPLIYPSPEMIWNTILTTKYILIYHIHLLTFQNFLFSSNYLMSILRLYKKESQTVHYCHFEWTFNQYTLLFFQFLFYSSQRILYLIERLNGKEQKRPKWNPGHGRCPPSPRHVKEAHTGWNRQAWVCLRLIKGKAPIGSGSHNPRIICWDSKGRSYRR